MTLIGRVCKAYLEAIHAAKQLSARLLRAWPKDKIACTLNEKIIAYCAYTRSKVSCTQRDLTGHTVPSSRIISSNGSPWRSAHA